MKTIAPGLPPSRPLRRDLGLVLLVTAAILAVPFTAMQFSTEVDWKLADFVIMGSLIATTGLMYVVVARHVRSRAQRWLAGGVLLLALLLMWAELAVGLFGTPFAGS